MSGRNKLLLLRYQGEVVRCHVPSTAQWDELQRSVAKRLDLPGGASLAALRSEDGSLVRCGEDAKSGERVKVELRFGAAKAATDPWGPLSARSHAEHEATNRARFQGQATSIVGGRRTGIVGGMGFAVTNAGQVTHAHQQQKHRPVPPLPLPKRTTAKTPRSHSHRQPQRSSAKDISTATDEHVVEDEDADAADWARGMLFTSRSESDPHSLEEDAMRYSAFATDRVFMPELSKADKSREVYERSECPQHTYSEWMWRQKNGIGLHRNAQHGQQEKRESKRPAWDSSVVPTTTRPNTEMRSWQAPTIFQRDEHGKTSKSRRTKRGLSAQKLPKSVQDGKSSVTRTQPSIADSRTFNLGDISLSQTSGVHVSEVPIQVAWATPR